MAMKTTPLLLLLVLLLPACKPEAPKTPPPAPSPKANLPEVDLQALRDQNTIKITLDQFNQILPGMTEAQVREIITFTESDRSSRFNPADEQGFTRPSATITLRWDNPDNSWCELEFRNKKVDQKRHQDLKPASGYAGTQFHLPIPAFSREDLTKPTP